MSVTVVDADAIGIVEAASTSEGARLTPIEALLTGLRVRKNEVQLTNCFSALASADPAVSTGLTMALLKSAAKDRLVGRRAAKLSERLPDTLRWSHQQRSTVGGKRRGVGIIDWTICSDANESPAPAFLLGVEVKIYAQIANPGRPTTRTWRISTPRPGVCCCWRAPARRAASFPMPTPTSTGRGSRCNTR